MVATSVYISGRSKEKKRKGRKRREEGILKEKSSNYQ